MGSEAGPGPVATTAPQQGFTPASHASGPKGITTSESRFQLLGKSVRMREPAGGTSHSARASSQTSHAPGFGEHPGRVAEN